MNTGRIAASKDAWTSLIALGCILLIPMGVAGCGSNRLASAGTPGRPTRQPVARPDGKDIPKVYDRRLDPQPLTEQQIAEILDYAAPLTPAGRSIWYIHVRLNVLHNGEADWNVLVFYTPDVVMPRMRKGKFTGISSMARLLKPLLAELQESTSCPNDANALDDYAQVSLADRPFGQLLDLPTEQLWPFFKPDDFTDAEIVQLVDFARTSPRVSHDKLTLPIPERFDGRAPIYRIKRNGDGEVEIRSGSMQAMLAGAGEILTCVKKGGKWVVLGIGMWAS